MKLLLCLALLMAVVCLVVMAEKDGLTETAERGIAFLMHKTIFDVVCSKRLMMLL